MQVSVCVSRYGIQPIYDKVSTQLKRWVRMSLDSKEMSIPLINQSSKATTVTDFHSGIFYIAMITHCRSEHRRAYEKWKLILKIWSSC